jgi:hypothetical protein
LEHISSAIFVKGREDANERAAGSMSILIGIAADPIGTSGTLVINPGNRRRVQLARKTLEGANKNNEQQPEAVVAILRTCTDQYALLYA